MTWILRVLTPIIFAKKGGLALYIIIMDLEAPPASANFLDCFPLLCYSECFELLAVVELLSMAPLSTDDTGCLGA